MEQPWHPLGGVQGVPGLPKPPTLPTRARTAAIIGGILLLFADATGATVDVYDGYNHYDYDTTFNATDSAGLMLTAGLAGILMLWAGIRLHRASKGAAEVPASGWVRSRAGLALLLAFAAVPMTADAASSGFYPGESLDFVWPAAAGVGAMVCCIVTFVSARHLPS